MDILGPLPQTPHKNGFLLVEPNYFAKWTEVYPIPIQEATTVAETELLVSLCVVLESPGSFTVTKLLYKFKSNVMVEVCELSTI